MNKIIILGLGPGDPDLLPSKSLAILRGSHRIYLRTKHHPTAESLSDEGITFQDFDYLYEECDNFSEVYQSMVNYLLKKADKFNEIVFAVPGHPMVAEKSVELLLDKAKQQYEIEIIPAMSCLDALYTALRVDPTEGLAVRDSLIAHSKDLDTGLPSLYTQLYSREIASHVKLDLMEYYPDDFKVKIVRAAMVPGLQRIEEIPLYELDRLKWIDHLTSLFVPAIENIDQDQDNLLKDLDSIMKELRGPGGCPWDREQDHDSLRRYLIEETYEVIEAIDEKNMNKLREELGDLLLQVVFHAQIAEENGDFDMGDVLKGLTKKLIRRHPHVFGGLEAKSVEDVNKTWEQVKKKEKMDRPRFDIPRHLPSLMRAEKIQKKASEVGFDWQNIDGPWAKIHEELQELSRALNGTENEIREELGDLLFAVVNVSRFLNVDPEEALSCAVNKFIERFNYIEHQLKAKNMTPEDAALDEMDRLWQQSKDR
ncbi:MAG: nucleoside triphosphate pyrophosphohydrolase [Clostridia bacterium]|nr:nucleoside triphosphate pyrophosphohydrolase [Clostridia bacterium]